MGEDDVATVAGPGTPARAVVNAEFDRIFRTRIPVPRTMAEATAYSDKLKLDIEEIQRQLKDEARRERLGPAEWFDWERRARRALRVKQLQQADLKAWRAARSLLRSPEEAEEARRRRREKHEARIREAAARVGVGDAPDPMVLLDLAHATLKNLAAEGVEFTTDEQALMDVIRERLNVAARMEGA